jgi:hypothetical protein
VLFTFARLQHRFELLDVVCIGRDVLGNDGLVFTIHHRLTVIALYPIGGCFEHLPFRIDRAPLANLVTGDNDGVVEEAGTGNGKVPFDAVNIVLATGFSMQRRIR